MSFKALGSLSFIITVLVLVTRHLFFLESKDYRISSMLKEMVNFLDVLDGTLTKSEQLTQEDPYHHLIEDVRPAYEKVSSIKKQTEIYEKMQRMPGGPTNFMSTSLEALDVIVKLIPILDKQYRLIVTEQKKEIGILQDEYKRLLQGLDTVFEDKSLEELEKVGIFLSDPSHLFTESQKNIELDSVKDKMSTLAEQFVQLETLQNEKSDAQAVDDQLKKEASKLIKEIADDIARDEQFFRLLMPKIGEQWKQLEEKVSRIGEHQNHVRTKYKQLFDQLESDVVRLSESINSLKHPKKNEL